MCRLGCYYLSTVRISLQEEVMFLTHEKKVNHPNMVNVIGFVHGLDQLDMMLEGAYYLLSFLRRNIILWAFFHY